MLTIVKGYKRKITELKKIVATVFKSYYLARVLSVHC